MLRWDVNIRELNVVYIPCYLIYFRWILIILSGVLIPTFQISNLGFESIFEGFWDNLYMSRTY